MVAMLPCSLALMLVTASGPIAIEEVWIESPSSGWALASRGPSGVVGHPLDVGNRPSRFLVRSSDAGRTWRDVSPAHDSRIVSFTPLGGDAARLVAITAVEWSNQTFAQTLTIETTKDGGRTWRVLETTTSTQAERSNAWKTTIDRQITWHTKHERQRPWRVRRPLLEPRKEARPADRPEALDFEGSFDGAKFFAKLANDDRSVHGALWYQTAAGGGRIAIEGTIEGDRWTIHEMGANGEALSTAVLQVTGSGGTGSWQGHGRSGPAQLAKRSSIAVGKRCAIERDVCVSVMGFARPCTIDRCAPAIFGDPDLAREARNNAVLEAWGSEAGVSELVKRRFETDFLSPDLLSFRFITHDIEGSTGNFLTGPFEIARSLDLVRSKLVRIEDIADPKRFRRATPAFLAAAHIDGLSCVADFPAQAATAFGLAERELVLCGSTCSNRSTGSACTRVPYASARKILRLDSPYAAQWSSK